MFPEGFLVFPSQSALHFLMYEQFHNIAYVYTSGPNCQFRSECKYCTSELSLGKYEVIEDR